MRLEDYFKALESEAHATIVSDEDDPESSVYDDYEYEIEPPIDYSFIMTGIEELKARTDPSAISSDVLERFRDCYRQWRKMNESQADLKHLVAEQEPPTELLLVLGDVDEDLQHVIDYRLAKNPKALVMDFNLYVCLADTGLELPSVTHLGLLHHAGRGLASLFTDRFFSDSLKKVGKSLANCSKFTERGCGMDDDKGLKEVLKRMERQPPRVLKPKDLRASTLDASDVNGKEAASSTLQAITTALIDGGLGRECPSALSIKFYVRGYKGSSKGAIPEVGVIDKDGKQDHRWMKFPKAVTFFDTRTAHAGAGSGAAADAEIDKEHAKLSKP